MRARRTLAAFACVLALTGAGAHAYASDDAPRWRIRVRPACMNAEDSAAHLRLRVYDATRRVAVYGCYRHGY